MKRLLYLCGMTLCLLVGCHQTKTVETTSLSISQPTAYIEFDQQYQMRMSDGTVKQVQEHIKMAQEPTKVIVLDMATLDSLYAVNIYQPIVGIRADANTLHHLPEYLYREFSKKQYTSVGNTQNLDFNKIKQLSPDVIFIGNEELDEATIKQLKQVVPTAKLVYTGLDSQDYLASLHQQSKLLGRIFNKTQLYDTFLKNIDLDVDYIRKFDKKDLKLAIVDVQGHHVALTTAYNDWLIQLGLEHHIYTLDNKEVVSEDIHSEEVPNQRVMIARESFTEDNSVVLNRQQQIDKEQQIVVDFDRNIAFYQPTVILFIDDVIKENGSNMPTILFAKYIKELPAVQNNHYRVVYATEWKSVKGGIYSYYTQVEDLVKALQK